MELIRATGDEDDVGRRLVVLPAFETLPFKSDGNQALNDLTHRVADFAQAADKDDLQVGFCLAAAVAMAGFTTPVCDAKGFGGLGFGQVV